MEIHFIEILQDNYVWVLREQDAAIVIDPGVAEPVRQYLSKQNLQLIGIWLTHHHHDHVGGAEALRQHYGAPVYASDTSELSYVDHRLRDRDIIMQPPFPSFHVLTVPGHTLDHIAFYSAPWLFCGDTLFSGGCGRLFEGTAAQLYHSLIRLRDLGDDTHVYCAHEYTINNLLFGLAVEPHNHDIQARLTQARQLRANSQPTVPSLMADEKRTNPFLRCHTEAVITALRERENVEYTDPIQCFATLRRWKNQFHPSR